MTAARVAVGKYDGQAGIDSIETGIRLLAALVELGGRPSLKCVG